MPFSTELMNYRRSLTRRGTVCLSEHTMEQLSEQLLLMKCCAPWPGPCGYCVREHRSSFLGKPFCLGQPKNIGINCCPSQDLLVCRGSQASFTPYPRFMVINNCYIWSLFFASSSLSKKILTKTYSKKFALTGTCQLILCVYVFLLFEEY